MSADDLSTEKAAVPVRCVCGAGCDFLPPESWGKPKAGDRLTCLDDPASQKAAQTHIVEARNALRTAHDHVTALLERDLSQTTTAAAQRCLWRIEAAQDELGMADAEL